MNQEILVHPEGSFFEGTRYILSCDSPEKEVVVLVHGIGSFSFQYEQLAMFLEKCGFCTLRYDLLGRGYSEYPSELRDSSGQSAFSGAGHVKQLRGLLKHLNITSNRYHIVAHSMGGAIAALYAHQYSSEILSMVFLSPAGLMDLGAVKFLRSCSCLQGVVKSVIKSGQEKAWRDDFYKHTGDSLDIENATVDALHDMMNTRPSVYDGFWESVLHFPLFGLEDTIESLASRHEIRICIMWGREDKAVPYNPNFSRWKRVFEGASHPHFSYCVYEGAAHAFFMEKADEVHNDIIDFLVRKANEQV